MKEKLKHREKMPREGLMGADTTGQDGVVQGALDPPTVLPHAMVHH